MQSDSGGVPKGAWLLLLVALFAVSSAGAVLQSMSEIPPILRASWRMQGTALILLPGFIFQLSSLDRNLFSSKDAVIILLSSIFLAAHFGSWVWSLDHTSLVHSLLFVTSHPLVVVLLMPILGSKIRRGHVIGASVGFFGAALTLKDIDGVTDIRGYGMMGGIDLRMDERPGKAGYNCFKSLFAAGLSLKATGDCLIVAPPFISEKKHIDEMIEKLRTGITNYFKDQ